MAERQRVTGIGGVFFKSRDSEAVSQWYARHLGVPYRAGEGAAFRWADDPQLDGGMTIWSAFPADTTYFNPSPAPLMINFCVSNLDALLAQLSSEGVRIDEKREDHEYGRFAWIYDPEGNKIELWEPLKPL